MTDVAGLGDVKVEFDWKYYIEDVRYTVYAIYIYLVSIYRLKVIVSNIISILASIWGRLPFWLIFKRFKT